MDKVEPVDPADPQFSLPASKLVPIQVFPDPSPGQGLALDHLGQLPPRVAGLLGEIKLRAATPSFDFPDIPQGYRDLRLVISAKGTVTTAQFDIARLRFNGDGGATQYGYSSWLGNSSAIGAAVDAQEDSIHMRYTLASDANVPAGNFGNIIASIPAYTTTDRKKHLMWQSTAFGHATTTTDMYTGHGGGLWRSDAAITRITILPINSTDWAIGSCAWLYGG